jgi:5'-nucleotidase
MYSPIRRTCTLTIYVAIASLAVAAQASALNIALSNDDGWDATGIQAMKAALVAAGHTVSLAAPLDEQSGSSAAGNFVSNLVVVKERNNEGANEFSVALSGGTEGAEPATSAMIAIDISSQLTGGPPDLVLMGINAGANVGAATQISGTVGGTIQTISNGLNGSLPAIAISTNELCDDDTPECEASNAAHFDNVASFMTDFIAHLETKPGNLAKEDRLLPDGVALNINYPPLAPDDVQGVKNSVQGKLFLFGGVPLNIAFQCFGPCNLLPVGVPTVGGIGGAGFDPTPDVSNSDAANFADGFITVVAIEADYTASPGVTNSLNSVVNGFDF